MNVFAPLKQGKQCFRRMIKSFVRPNAASNEILQLNQQGWKQKIWYDVGRPSDRLYCDHGLGCALVESISYSLLPSCCRAGAFRRARSALQPRPEITTTPWRSGGPEDLIRCEVPGEVVPLPETAG